MHHLQYAPVHVYGTGHLAGSPVRRLRVVRPVRRVERKRNLVVQRGVRRAIRVFAQKRKRRRAARREHGMEIPGALQYLGSRGVAGRSVRRDGLYRLISNVLFVEDPHQPDMYHPRIGAWQESVYEALTAEEKDAYMRLYNNFFYQRHNFFWGQNALHRLTDTVCQTQMLCCAEDLGMLPDCVSHVLDHLRILTLEIQSMPKQNGFEFAHLDGNPYRSVATFSTHDMSPLRLWWEESPERTQRYYATMLQKQGRAPEHLPVHLAEEIIARHLYCPSMLCLLSLQDWLSMDGELRSKHLREERINVPSDPYNHWKYRMHITIEELMEAIRYNNKVRTMITRSKR